MKQASVDRSAGEAEPRRSLELDIPRDEVVHLWVRQDRAFSGAWLSALERLLCARCPHGGSCLPRYRFLGASRVRRRGVDGLCMSFCPARERD